MSVEEELGKFSPQKEMLLTIGVFDGVHLGHKHLISKLKELAGKLGTTIIYVTHDCRQAGLFKRGDNL